MSLSDLLPDAQKIEQYWETHAESYTVDFFVTKDQVHRFNFELDELRNPPYEDWYDLDDDMKTKKWMLSHAIDRAYDNISELFLCFRFAERYMRVYMMLVCLHGVQPLSVSYFTAIGNVRQGIVLSLSRQGFFLIPLLLLLLLFGLNGALYAGPIADSLACMLSLALVFRNFRELTAMRIQG